MFLLTRKPSLFLHLYVNKYIHICSGAKFIAKVFAVFILLRKSLFVVTDV